MHKSSSSKEPFEFGKNYFFFIFTSLSKMMEYSNASVDFYEFYFNFARCARIQGYPTGKLQFSLAYVQLNYSTI